MFVAHETFFTCIFYARGPNFTDDYFEWMLPFQRAKVPWTPLCPHVPLHDIIRGADSTTTAEDGAKRAFQNAEIQRKLLYLTHLL